MPGAIEARLAELDLTLPPASAPQGNYVAYTISGQLVFVAGQIALVDGAVRHRGTVGQDVSLEEAQQAARLCALNIIAQVKAACGGDLDRVVRCLKLGGFVKCGVDFNDQPKVINGASDLLVEVFGDKGRHARFAVGAPSLPLGASVEIDAIFEIA